MDTADAASPRRNDLVSAQLVDLLWKLKKRYQTHIGTHIHLNILVNDYNYRENLLRDAQQSGVEELERLVEEVRGHQRELARLQMRTFAAAVPDRPAGPANYGRWGMVGVSAIGLLAILATSMLGYFFSDALRASLNNTATPTGQTASLLPADNARLVLRIHGSNTVGEKLAPSLVEAFLRAQGAVETRIIAGGSPVEKTVQAIVPGQPLPLAVEIQAHGSSTAFQDLVNGGGDMGMSSRRIKQSEAEELRPLHGDLISANSEHVIGLDGLAVITHPSNPISELTIEQVAKLFSGEFDNWSQVGGKDQPVSRYARDGNSGTWDTFKNLVLKPHKLKLHESVKRYESSTQLSDEVAANVGAIGFIGLPYVRRAKLLGIAESAGTTAIIPTTFTVGTEDYPLSRRLYFYTPEHALNPFMRDLAEFALSSHGQEIVRQTGFISQNIYTEKPRADSSYPFRYLAMTRNAERLSVNFRFHQSSEGLDNKSLRDLNRLMEFMAQHRGRNVLLLGFTDNLGDRQANQALSLERAKMVEKALVARGISPKAVHGFGEAIPLASNATPYGRDKNRRVEVWIE